MGPQEDYIETVLTCEGDYYDPDFHSNLNSFRKRLQDLIGSEKSTLILKKVEPWNSVRVTFNIPKEAAVRLRHLAEQGDHTLRDLGILAVQIEGDRLISLTIAGKNNEPTELVFRTNTPRQAASSSVTSSVFDFSTSEDVLPGPNVETTRKNIVDYLRQQGTPAAVFDSILSQTESPGVLQKPKVSQAEEGRGLPIGVPLQTGIAPSGKSPSHTPSHTPPFQFQPAQANPDVSQHMNIPPSLASQLSSACLSKDPRAAAELVMQLSQDSNMLKNLPPGLFGRTLSATSPLLVNLLQNEQAGAHLNNIIQSKTAMMEGALNPTPPKRKRRPRKPKAPAPQAVETTAAPMELDKMPGSSTGTMPSSAQSVFQRVPPLPVVPRANHPSSSTLSFPPASSVPLQASVSLTSIPASSTAVSAPGTHTAVVDSSSSIPLPAASIRPAKTLAHAGPQTTSHQSLIQTIAQPPVDNFAGKLINPFTGQFELVTSEDSIMTETSNTNTFVAGQLKSGISCANLKDSSQFTPPHVAAPIGSGSVIRLQGTSLHGVRPGLGLTSTLTVSNPRMVLQAGGMPSASSTSTVAAPPLSIADLMRTVPVPLDLGQMGGQSGNSGDLVSSLNSLTHRSIPAPVVTTSHCSMLPQTIVGPSSVAVSSSVTHHPHSSPLHSHKPTLLPGTLPDAGHPVLLSQNDSVPSACENAETISTSLPSGPNSESSSSPADSGVSSTMVQSSTPNAQPDSRSPTSEISQESLSLCKDLMSDTDENRSTDSEHKLSPNLTLSSVVTQAHVLGANELQGGIVHNAHSKITVSSHPSGHARPVLVLQKQASDSISPVIEPMKSKTSHHTVNSAVPEHLQNCDIDAVHHSNDCSIPTDHPKLLSNGPVPSPVEQSMVNAGTDKLSVPSDPVKTGINDNQERKPMHDSTMLTVGMALDSRECQLPPGVFMEKMLNPKEHPDVVSRMAHGKHFLSKSDYSKHYETLSGTKVSELPWKARVDSIIDKAFTDPWKSEVRASEDLNLGSVDRELEMECNAIGSRICGNTRNVDAVDSEGEVCSTALSNGDATKTPESLVTGGLVNGKDTFSRGKQPSLDYSASVCKTSENGDCDDGSRKMNRDGLSAQHFESQQQDPDQSGLTPGGSSEKQSRVRSPAHAEDARPADTAAAVPDRGAGSLRNSSTVAATKENPARSSDQNAATEDKRDKGMTVEQSQINLVGCQNHTEEPNHKQNNNGDLEITDLKSGVKSAVSADLPGSTIDSQPLLIQDNISADLASPNKSNSLTIETGPIASDKCAVVDHVYCSPVKAADACIDDSADNCSGEAHEALYKEGMPVNREKGKEINESKTVSGSRSSDVSTQGENSRTVPSNPEGSNPHHVEGYANKPLCFDHNPNNGAIPVSAPDQVPDRVDDGGSAGGPVQPGVAGSVQPSNQGRTVSNVRSTSIDMDSENKGQQQTDLYHDLQELKTPASAPVVYAKVPKKDYTDSFILKSKQTPARANAVRPVLMNAAHTLVSPQYPMDLTESVQRLVKPLPNETVTPAVNGPVITMSRSSQAAVVSHSKLTSFTATSHVNNEILEKEQNMHKNKDNIQRVAGEINDSVKVDSSDEVLNDHGKIISGPADGPNNIDANASSRSCNKKDDSAASLPSASIPSEPPDRIGHKDETVQETQTCIDAMGAPQVSEEQHPEESRESDCLVEESSAEIKQLTVVTEPPGNINLDSNSTSLLPAVTVCASSSPPPAASQLSPEITESLRMHSYSSPVKMPNEGLAHAVTPNAQTTTETVAAVDQPVCLLNNSQAGRTCPSQETLIEEGSVLTQASASASHEPLGLVTTIKLPSEEATSLTTPSQPGRILRRKSRSSSDSSGPSQESTAQESFNIITEDPAEEEAHLDANNTNDIEIQIHISGNTSFPKTAPRSVRRKGSPAGGATEPESAAERRSTRGLKRKLSLSEDPNTDESKRSCSSTENGPDENFISNPLLGKFDKKDILSVGDNCVVLDSTGHPTEPEKVQKLIGRKVPLVTNNTKVAVCGKNGPSFPGVDGDDGVTADHNEDGLAQSRERRGRTPTDQMMLQSKGVLKGPSPNRQTPPGAGEGGPEGKFKRATRSQKTKEHCELPPAAKRKRGQKEK